MRIFQEGLAAAGLVFQAAVVWNLRHSGIERIPTHFGISGRPDAYGNTSSMFLLLTVTAGLYALLTVVSFFPQTFNYPVAVTEANRPRLEAISVSMLGWLKAELTWLFAYIAWDTARVASGAATGLGWGFLMLLLSVGATIVIGIVQMRATGK